MPVPTIMPMIIPVQVVPIKLFRVRHLLIGNPYASSSDLFYKEAMHIVAVVPVLLMKLFNSCLKVLLDVLFSWFLAFSSQPDPFRPLRSLRVTGPWLTRPLSYSRFETYSLFHWLMESSEPKRKRK